MKKFLTLFTTAFFEIEEIFSLISMTWIFMVLNL